MSKHLDTLKEYFASSFSSKCDTAKRKNGHRIPQVLMHLMIYAFIRFSEIKISVRSFIVSTALATWAIWKFVSIKFLRWLNYITLHSIRLFCFSRPEWNHFGSYSLYLTTHMLKRTLISLGFIWPHSSASLKEKTQSHRHIRWYHMHDNMKQISAVFSELNVSKFSIYEVPIS